MLERDWSRIHKLSFMSNKTQEMSSSNSWLTFIENDFIYYLCIQRKLCWRLFIVNHSSTNRAFVFGFLKVSWWIWYDAMYAENGLGKGYLLKNQRNEQAIDVQPNQLKASTFSIGSHLHSPNALMLARVLVNARQISSRHCPTPIRQLRCNEQASSPKLVSHYFLCLLNKLSNMIQFFNKAILKKTHWHRNKIELILVIFFCYGIQVLEIEIQFLKEISTYLTSSF